MNEERRKHSECLRQEEWGEIKSFVTNTADYRRDLKATLEEIKKENKERFEILITQIRSDKTDMDIIVKQVARNLEREQEKRDVDHKDREQRIRGLEKFRWIVGGAVAIVITVLIPIAIAVIK